MKFRFPGSVTLAAGIATVSSVLFTYVAAMFVPFIATVELAVNPVPASVTVAAVLIGPALGEMEVSVGAGGLSMDTLTGADVEGEAAWLETVMLAVPSEARRLAGTSACIDS